MARARGPSGLILRSVFALLGLTLIVPAALRGQGVTTGALSGTVVSSTGESVVGATVVATHEPSGSQYGTVVREGGAYEIDYTFCKGCGICVSECPREAMEMVPL